MSFRHCPVLLLACRAAFPAQLSHATRHACSAEPLSPYTSSATRRYGNGRLEGIAAAETVDATGCIVTPGWVDAHTHMDGQVTWDPWLTPSSETGVTTAIMGNCGVGFAPCAASRRDFLMNLVEAIEDIPGTAIMEGLVWEWETFEEYLDALDRRSVA